MRITRTIERPATGSPSLACNSVSTWPLMFSRNSGRTSTANCVESTGSPIIQRNNFNPSKLIFPAGAAPVDHRGCAAGVRLCRYLSGNPSAPGVHLTNRLRQFAGRRGLEEIATSPGCKSALDVDVTGECRQHDDTGFRRLGQDRDHRIDPAQVRDSEVHQSHVGPLFAMAPDRLDATGRLRNKHHVGLAIDNRSDAFPDKRMVVDTQYANPGLFDHGTSIHPSSIITEFLLARIP